MHAQHITPCHHMLNNDVGMTLAHHVLTDTYAEVRRPDYNAEGISHITHITK